MNKLVSKLFRQKLRGEIESLIKEMGFKDLTESQIGNYIYSGNGHISTGLNVMNVNFRLKLEQDRIIISLKNDGDLVNIEYDAHTKEELNQFPLYFHSQFNMLLN